jgi:hypothetical protein
MFKQYLEAVIKERTEPKRFPAPKGFKKISTGGSPTIYMYAGTLANGKYVELFGAEDIQENDKGFDIVAKGERHNVANLYPSDKETSPHQQIGDEKYFKNEKELKAILDKWSEFKWNK